MLEQSRTFYFHDDGAERYFVGSADRMERTLGNGVEAVAPIRDPSLQARLDRVLETCLADDRNAWDLQSDGKYVQRTPCDEESERPAQDIFMPEVVNARPD